jgi:hypothetical protein
MEYCVYFHINKSNSDIFYVGIGNKKRPYSKRSRSQFWKNTVEKYDYLVEIIHTELSFEEACELERYYIRMFGRLDIGSGSLVNLTDGGDGSNGYIHSEETKVKIKQNWSNYRGFELPEDITKYNRDYQRNYMREYRKNESVREKYRESYRIKYQNMSDIEKEELSETKRRYREGLSEEQREELRNRNRKYREGLSEEQREELRRKNRERMREIRLKDKINKNSEL